MSLIYAGAGAIERGQLTLYDQREMDAIIRKVREDIAVEFTVEKLYPTRTHQANKYYWSVVIPRVKERLGLVTRHVTHEVLKAQFMDPRLLRTGKIKGYVSEHGLMLGTSTRDLDSFEFFDYLERICEHAAEYWKDATGMGLYIPPPDPLWREHALAELARLHLRAGEVPFDEVE